MKRDEVVSKIVELLRLHKDGLRGSLHQEPYKGDAFNIFADAFNNGLIGSPSQSDYLSADALRNELDSRAPELVEQEAWGILNRFWADWTYAWDNADKLHHGQ